MNIVKRALEEPMRQIAMNAGHEGAVVVGRVRDSKEDNFGFNADTAVPATWSRPESSILPRSRAWPCKTQLPSLP